MLKNETMYHFRSGAHLWSAPVCVKTPVVDMVAVMFKAQHMKDD